jgi:hypothetical protein
LEKENVWIFIFKNNSPELEEAVDEIDKVKKFNGEKGWDLLVSK